jgi:hypothetical protein
LRRVFDAAVWRLFEREMLSAAPPAVIDPQYSGGVLQGYMIGFGINAVVLIVSGLPVCSCCGPIPKERA